MLKNETNVSLKNLYHTYTNFIDKAMSCNSHPSLYITFDPLKKKTVFPKYANIYLIKYFKIQFKILVKIILTLKKTCKSETFRQIQV